MMKYLLYKINHFYGLLGLKFSISSLVPKYLSISPFFPIKKFSNESALNTYRDGFLDSRTVNHPFGAIFAIPFSEITFWPLKLRKILLLPKQSLEIILNSSFGINYSKLEFFGIKESSVTTTSVSMFVCTMWVSTFLRIVPLIPKRKCSFDSLKRPFIRLNELVKDSVFLSFFSKMDGF